jgi:primosomal protein N''
MLDHFCAKRPKFWWVITSVLTHVLDHKNLTKAQKVLFELDFDAYLFLLDALSFELFYKVNHKGTTHELWESIKHTFGDSSIWDDGKFKKENEPKEDAHEDVEHDHNLVIVEDCSASWSSDDDDDRSTTSSPDKIDDDALSDANNDATSCTLDGDNDGSCSNHDCDAATSPSTTPHCFMSQDDTKVQKAIVVDHIDSYDELVSRLTSMTMSLENEKTKTLKLENENTFLKNLCEEHKHLLDVLKSSHEELIVTHEKLCASHEELIEQHASLIKAFSKKIKKNESSSHGSNDQLQNIANPCDVGKKHVSTSCDDLLDMPCSSCINACSTSMSCETNLLKENNELKREVKNLSNRLERCYNSKVTFEHMLKTQRNFGDKSGLGFKRKMTKGEIKREKKMKKQL